MAQPTPENSTKKHNAPASASPSTPTTPSTSASGKTISTMRKATTSTTMANGIKDKSTLDSNRGKANFIT